MARRDRDQFDGIGVILLLATSILFLALIPVSAGAITDTTLTHGLEDDRNTAEQRSGSTLQFGTENQTGAVFEVTIVEVPERVYAGDEIFVAYSVENVGEDVGEQDIVFTVDGDEVHVGEEVELEPGETTEETVVYETDSDDAPELAGSIASEDDSDEATVTITAGAVALESEITADQETIVAEVSFENTMGDDAALLVENAETGERYTELLEEDGEIVVPVEEMGGVEAGDEIEARLYETPDMETVLDTDSTVVDATAEPTGTVAFEEPVTDNQTTVEVDVGFNDTDSVALVVINENREAATSVVVEADGVQEIAVDDIGGIEADERLIAELYESSEFETVLDAETTVVEAAAEPTGTVDLEAEITEDQEIIAAEVSFENTIGEDAALLVENLETDDAYTELVEEDGESAVPVEALGGIQSGDEIEARLYETPDMVTLLDSDSTVVEALDVIQLEECTTIQEPGEYVLGANLTQETADTCLDIQSDDVSLDGQGHYVTDGGDGSAGVRVEGVENVDVHDLTVSGWESLDAGVYVRESSNITVESVGAVDGTFGIRFTAVDEFTVKRSYVEGHTRAGVQVYESTRGTLSNLTAHSNAQADRWSSVFIRDGSSEVTLENVIAVESPAGGNGITVTNGASDITVSESVAVNNDGSGFQFDTPDVTVSTITAMHNGWDVTVNAEGVTVDTLDIGPSVAPATVLSFEASHTQVRSVASPPENALGTSIGRYVEVAETGTQGYLDLELGYESADVDEVDADTLRLWRHDDSEWTEIADSVVDTDEQVVSHNMTTFGTFGLFAQDSGGELELEPEELHFPETTTDESVTEVLEATNTGDSSLTVETTLEGADAEAFDVSVSEFSLEPGELLELHVLFAAPSEGTFEATLVVSDADGTRLEAVPLTATVEEEETTPPPEPSPPSQDDDDADDGDAEEDDEQDVQVETESDSDETGGSVEATVEDAPAGERVEIEIPEPTQEQNYQLETLSVTPAADSSFSLSVETSSAPLETTPAGEFEFDRTTELGYLSVETDLDDEAIDETEFTFRVSEDQLDEWESGPEDVSLYRYDEETGTWDEHETTVIGQEDGDVLLQTTADGFSDWTAAAKRPDLDITDTEIDVEVATTEDDVTIQVFVTNTGGADGTYEAQLLANEEIIDREDATVPSNQTIIVDFVRSFDQPDRYEVRVNDVRVGEVNITTDEDVTVDTPTPTPEDDGERTPADDTSETPPADDAADDGAPETAPADDDADDGFLDGFGPGFGVVSALVALLLTGALHVYRRDE